MVFFISSEDIEGKLSISWFTLVTLDRIPNGQTATYNAFFWSGDFMYTFLSDDPDEPMLNDI